ncbi:prenyltransferase/squalene oxidase repeat-containing protein [Thermococcus sp. 21S7]|uniref:prenyltransferase/squalene oxidase repeat-containing protein n=1 Tax=Thermococcus sp. 21S7 TaxID=1638221 RepID=UPI00143BAB04|nr:prenyltransferase/squalene oxidase repeat-containing protein [Thermococcus sp. 21S7]NJE61795.1 hypothetical protein [Thermococcus sp. 21S7]
MVEGLNGYVHSLLNEATRHLVVNDSMAYIEDPVFDVIRNRVTAEYLKAVIRLYGGERADLITKLVNFLLSRQNSSGSWNEIHPNYNQESALVTSFVGEALLMALPYLREEMGERVRASLKRARDFVLLNEIEEGYFRKSTLYTADYLNVDATCGAFLAQYHDSTGDKAALEGALRAAKRVCRFQEADGSFPYTVNSGSEKYPLNVPCIHYQGVTLYYLSKIHAVTREKWLEKCLLRGVDWLSRVQKSDGRFDWSRSGLMFAYYLTGAYAFGIAAFIYASQWSRKYIENAGRLLPVLADNTPNIVLRWERGRWGDFPKDLLVSFRSAWLGKYPFTHRLFRLGYALYRQVARRRFSEDVRDDAVFNLLTRLLGVKTSTIEPSRNFPDMFMTSEVLDCLSYTLRLSY